MWMTSPGGRFSPFLQAKSESNKLSPFMFASGYAKTYPHQKLLPTSYQVARQSIHSHPQVANKYMLAKNRRITHIIKMLSLPCGQKLNTPDDAHYNPS